MNTLDCVVESAWHRRDQRLCRLANRWGERRSILQAFGIVSRLGDGIAWYVLMALLLISGTTAGPQAAVHMAIVSVVACLLYRYLKRWSRRPRPFRRYHDIIARIAPLDEFSFPSGHTLHAVHFSTVAIAYFPALVVVLVPFAILIAMSRVVLGLHYPSDVLAATAIGLALAGGSLGLLPLVAAMG